MANNKRSITERTTGISITLPNWMIDEIDKRGDNRSSTISILLADALAKNGNETVLERQLIEIAEDRARLDDREEQIHSLLAAMNASTKRLDDPLVQEAIHIIAARAVNYSKSEGEIMQDRAIRNMAEKYLKGPMPQGFIERVRVSIDGKL